MINLIGAFITVLFLVAFVLHRPNRTWIEEELLRSTLFRASIAIILGLGTLDRAFVSIHLPFVLILPVSILLIVGVWIHEGGHVFWGPLGDFMAVLGGTLTQLLVPSALCVYFWWGKARTTALLPLWWLGANCLDIASYIGDAHARVLPLLGGDHGRHDWAEMLGAMGVIERDLQLSWLVWSFGLILSVASLALFVLGIPRPSTDGPLATTK